MSENKKTIEATNIDKNAEYEAVVAELKKAQDTISQYEAAYKDLQSRFNRLSGILNAQIEYTLSIK